MDGRQISEVLNEDPIVRRQFGGVLASDELPIVITQRPRFYVVNTDIRRLPGSHWIVFYFPKRGSAEFFDPLGRSPGYYHGRFVTWLRRHGPRFIHNKNRVQPYGTNTCGQYCMLYVKYRCRGWTITRVSSYLKTNII